MWIPSSSSESSLSSSLKTDCGDLNWPLVVSTPSNRNKSSVTAMAHSTSSSTFFIKIIQNLDFIYQGVTWPRTALESLNTALTVFTGDCLGFILSGEDCGAPPVFLARLDGNIDWMWRILDRSSSAFCLRRFRVSVTWEGKVVLFSCSKVFSILSLCSDTFSSSVKKLNECIHYIATYSHII